MSDSHRSGGPSRRLFVQGTRENDDKDNVKDLSTDVQDLQAVHTRRHLSTDVHGSSEESSKKFRNAGTKYITTRLVRKTTTLTRGEEKSVSESMMRSGESSIVEHGTERNVNRLYHSSSKAKRAKVKEKKFGSKSFITLEKRNFALLCGVDVSVYDVHGAQALACR